MNVLNILRSEKLELKLIALSHFRFRYSASLILFKFQQRNLNKMFDMPKSISLFSNFICICALIWGIAVEGMKADDESFRLKSYKAAFAGVNAQKAAARAGYENFLITWAFENFSVIVTLLF